MKSSLPLGFFLVALLLSGCRHVNHETAPKVSGVAVANSDLGNVVAYPEVDKRSEAHARFTTGISYELTDQPDLALEEFSRAAFADPSNETLAIELGQRFLQARQPKKAIDVLSYTAKRPEASGAVFSWLALAYAADAQTNLAIKASQNAIQKSPEMISAYQTLADIFLKNGQHEKLVAQLESASDLRSRDPVFLVQLGALYAKVFSVQPENTALQKRGLDALQRASHLDPANPNVRQKMADSFAQLGDVKTSAEIYLQLLGEFRDMPLMRDALREKLANIYLISRDQLKASEQLEAIVRDSPTRYPEAWYYLGTFAYDEKNYDKATDYFNRAITVKPDLEPAYIDLAGTHLNLDEAGKALKTLDRARAKFPRSFAVEFFTGLAFARLKNFPEALKHFTAAEFIGNATDVKRLNHLFYFQVGSTYERNRDYEQAEKYFDKCLKLEPDFAEALNYLGYMWAEQGIHLEKARGLIEKAVKLEPKNPAYLDSFGWVLFKLNEPKPALEYLLQAAELSQEPDPTVFDHIGDVYRVLKQDDKAREAWQKSLTIEPNEDIRKKLQTDSSL